MIDRFRARPFALCLVLLATIATAQNRAHPGLVHLGDGRWGTPEEAVAAGRFEYHGRWLPTKLERKLRTWEKADAKKGLAWENAYRTRSKHYRITTNVPRFIVELEIKPFLDELFQTYRLVFKEKFGLKGKAADKKFVKIYHGYEDYHEHEERTRRTPGFLRSGNELVTFYEETDPARFYRTAFHEGGHQFFRAMLPGAALPKWLSEALATYFEGCVYSRATQKITVGFFPPNRLRIAQNLLARAGDDASPQTMFMNVPDDRFRATQYALAWSFVYYLTHVDDGEHRDGFGKFLRTMNGAGARPLTEVFRNATKTDFAELGAGWRDYVLALEPPAAPKWVVLGVKGESPLESGDLVWSVDGIEVYDIAQFKQLWKASTEPREVVVVRRDGDPKTGHYSTRFESARIDPKRVQLRPTATVPRAHALID